MPTTRRVDRRSSRLDLCSRLDHMVLFYPIMLHTPDTWFSRTPVLLAALAAGLLCHPLILPAAQTVPAGTNAHSAGISILQWNTENLFDANDDPANDGDDEFTPTSWRRWTADLYRLKLMHLASVLAFLKPDVVTLEEIENRRVLTDLADEVRRMKGPDYRYIAHREGTDHRGIDVAALSVFKPRDTRWLTPIPGQRDILRLDIQPLGRPLSILVNHWKSRWGGAQETAPVRAAQAKALRAEIDAIRSANSNAAIVVTGDFNEDMGGPAQSGSGGITTNRAEVIGQPTAGLLYNLHASLPAADRGTFYYQADKTWNSFDNISVTASILGEGRGPWKLVPAGYRVIREPRLLNDEGHPLRFRSVYDRTTKHRSYEKGYSDHLPVMLRLAPR